MNDNYLQLITPNISLKEEFFALKQEYDLLGDNEHHRAISVLYDTNITKSNFPKYIQRLHDISEGKNLKPGYVPASIFWLVRDNTTLIGVSDLRHSLSPNLLQRGGHIGYNIRPSER